MNVEFSSYGVALLIIQGLVIMAMLRGLRGLVQRARMSSTARARVEKLLPVAEAIIALVYLLSAIPQILKDDPEWSPIAVAVVLVGVGYVSWFAIRDYVSGVFLRAGRVVREGDQVTADGHSGEVLRLGFRTLTIQTPDDREAVIPYTDLARRTIVRRTLEAPVVRHELRLPRPDPLPPHIERHLGQAAALHHWCTVSPPVTVDIQAETLLVVVHLVAKEHASHVERHLERVLESLKTTAP